VHCLVQGAGRLQLVHDLIRLNIRNKLAASIPHDECENLRGIAVGLSVERPTKQRDKWVSKQQPHTAKTPQERALRKQSE